jgi:hypothetical protein
MEISTAVSPLVTDVQALWLNSMRDMLAGLKDSAKIQSGKTDLKQYQCYCTNVNPPNNPQNVTEKEQPEPLVAFHVR